MNTFKKFDLSNEVLRSLAQMGLSEPTPVQDDAITPMMQKRDMLVQAPTGTGKTCAFGIPVIEACDRKNPTIQTVILSPTRELAIQTTGVLQKLTTFSQGIRVLALYGGEPIYKQITALRKKPQIIVATPGRLMDHMQRRTVRLNSVNLVVLDEADRMLDMGFRNDIDKILADMPKQKQLALFSATISADIKRIATKYQTNAKTIVVEDDSNNVATIEQHYTRLRAREKNPALIQLLNEKNYKLTLVFVATKRMADRLATQLQRAKFSADSIHGDLRQSQRDAVMRKYRTGRVNILVATDVAARGIDVDDIDAVINYDIPGDAESYVHRVGRTGRANKTGIAYTFVYQDEYAKLQEIMRTTHMEIEPFDIPLAGSSNTSQPASNVIDEAPQSSSSSAKPAKKKHTGGPRNFKPRRQNQQRKKSAQS